MTTAGASSRPRLTTWPSWPWQREGLRQVFNVDPSLIEGSARRLRARGGLYWIVGGSCSGKTTVCRAVSQQTGIAVYDMDAHVYGAYMGRYSPSRHPASCAWFRRPDALRWALTLSSDKFSSLSAAVDAEMLDLLSDDLGDLGDATPVLIDGGITHPSVLAAAVRPARIACLAIADSESRRIWETDPSRRDMRMAVQRPPGGQDAWATFLEFNRRISETAEAEARQAGIRVHTRSTALSAEALADAVSRGLGVAAASAPRLPSGLTGEASPRPGVAQS